MKTLLSIFALALLLSGCAHLDPEGVYKGDKIIYSAELITPTAFDLLHTFVSWEQKNRTMLTKWPEVTAYADIVRSNANQWFTTANVLHDSYKANPNEENRQSLAMALRIIQAALVQANDYMLKAAQTK